jgi:hypothetical protein
MTTQVDADPDVEVCLSPASLTRGVSMLLNTPYNYDLHMDLVEGEIDGKLVGPQSQREKLLQELSERRAPIVQIARRQKTEHTKVEECPRPEVHVIEMSEESVRQEFRAECDGQGTEFKKDDDFDKKFAKEFRAWYKCENRHDKPDEFKGYLTIREDRV